MAGPQLLLETGTRAPDFCAGQMYAIAPSPLPCRGFSGEQKIFVKPKIRRNPSPVNTKNSESQIKTQTFFCEHKISLLAFTRFSFFTFIRFCVHQRNLYGLLLRSSMGNALYKAFPVLHQCPPKVDDLDLVKGVSQRLWRRVLELLTWCRSNAKPSYT